MRSKRMWKTLLIVSLAILCGSSLAMAKTELSMTTAYMNTHPTVINAWEPWFKEINKMTNGEVSITFFNPNTLTPMSNNYDSTIAGTVGLGSNGCSLNAGKFPLSDVIGLPGIVPSAECGSLVFWDLYRKYPELQSEYKDVKLLWLWTSATYQIHTTKKPVKTIDDLKGMKIICWDRVSVDIMRALGANTLLLQHTDSYLALERGMADGVFCPLAPIISFKISDAAKYTTVCDIMVTGFWAGIGPTVWKNISPASQDVLVKTTGENMAKASGLTLDQGAVSDSEKLKAKGHTFIMLPESDHAKIIKATAPIRDSWVSNMEKAGYKNAKAMMEDAFALSKKYAPVTGRGYKQ